MLVGLMIAFFISFDPQIYQRLVPTSHPRKNALEHGRYKLTSYGVQETRLIKGMAVFYHDSCATDDSCNGPRSEACTVSVDKSKRTPGMIHNPFRPIYCLNTDVTLMNDISWEHGAG
jgi:hypothetical protein